MPQGTAEPSLTPQSLMQAQQLGRAVIEEVGRVFIGNSALVEALLLGLISRGHVLLEGVPGVAKTTLVKAFAQVLGCQFRRVQFTPDLLPSDITGTYILDPVRKDFVLREGPIFSQIILGDEINRAPPKTQSALLEAMQEGQVTLEGESRPLPQPFMVLATQNPIEHEGTYPLPEAQLDRFLLQVDVDYPTLDAERRILLATTGAEDAVSAAVMDSGGLEAIQNLVRRMPAGETVVEAILRLVRAARPTGQGAFDFVQRTVSWGPGPRAAQALMMAVRAKALIEGRLAPSVADVAELAVPALKHRMALSFAAKAEGDTVDRVIGAVAARTVETAAAA